jgi:hypothetical protein
MGVSFKGYCAWDSGMSLASTRARQASHKKNVWKFFIFAENFGKIYFIYS